jgi:hypothetical protein
MRALITEEELDQSIFVLRGHRVMLDSDLARVYGVPVKRLNEQVRRNAKRFPPDFMFQATKKEADFLRSQFATLNIGRGKHRKYLPYAFTEHGAVMLAAVLNSPVAIKASVQIVRAFNRLRRMALAHKDLALAVEELARRVKGHDEQFKLVFEALQELMEPPEPPRKQIGFVVPEKPKPET